MSVFGSYASAVNLDAFQPNAVEPSQCVLRDPDTFPENVFVKLPKLLQNFPIKIACIQQSEDGNALDFNVTFAHSQEPIAFEFAKHSKPKANHCHATPPDTTRFYIINPKPITLRFEKYSEPKANDYYAAVPAITRFYIINPKVKEGKFQGIVFEKDNTPWVKIAIAFEGNVIPSYPEGAVVEIAFPFSMKDKPEFETTVSLNAKNIKDADISAGEASLLARFQINNSDNKIADVWDLITARDFRVKLDINVKDYRWGLRGLRQFSAGDFDMNFNFLYKNQFIVKDSSMLISLKNYLMTGKNGEVEFGMDGSLKFNITLDPGSGYQLNVLLDTSMSEMEGRRFGAIKLFDVALTQLDAASIDAIVTAANRALVVQLRSQMSGPNAPSVAAVKESAHQLTQSLEENIPKIFSKPTVLRLNSSWHSVNDILLYDLKAIFAFQPLSAYIREKPNLLDMVRNRPIDSINKLIKSVYFNFKIDDKNIVSELSSEKEMNQYEAQNVKQLNAVIVILKMLGIIQPDAGKIGVDLRFENNQLVLNGKVIDLERLMSLLESANHYLSK